MPTFSATVKCGNNNGSENKIPICRFSAGRNEISFSFRKTLPSETISASGMPAIHLRNEVFPVPLLDCNKHISPFSIVRLKG